MTSETFPYYAEDGYVVGGCFACGWKTVSYFGLYRETNGMPRQWNRCLKTHKPIAYFITGQWRTKHRQDKKLIYRCDTTYRHSEN